MESSRDPFAIAALVGAGTLVGHELGYLADTSASAGHGYFALITPLAIVGVVLAVWGSAVSVLRRGTALAPKATTLAAAQTLLYIGFEVGERTLGSTESSLLSLPVLFGLLVQPLVAWLAVSALRLTAAVLAAVVRGRDRIALGFSTHGAKTHSASPQVIVPMSAPARAPPLAF